MTDVMLQFNFWSLIDIIFITVALYHLLLLIRGTRAAHMLTGLFLVAIVFQATSFVPLTTVNWILNKFYSSIVIILIILFQEDIRNALSKIGKKSLAQGKEIISDIHTLDELAKAAALLAEHKIGALIVIERNIILSRYIDIGVSLDAKISKELLFSIFHTSSPIHDGAVIIQEGRISAAGCFLPIIRFENLNQEMGTRHRAAIGITRETDCIVILVSEERGTFGLVVEGIIQNVPDAAFLRKLLQRHISEKSDQYRSSKVLKKARWSFSAKK
ncbi:MAG: diadenylate cyclase CdaA [Oligoflexales bacterium]|nr:diadenylate cyclase CdaA [Oligoflexales bacterium]